MKFPSVIFVIIPVHNRKELTRNCLLSLCQQTFKNFETVIVDDGSTDGTAEMLQNEFPAVHVLKGNGNLWWAGAINAGIEYITKNLSFGATDFILSLNNDLEVSQEYLHVLAENARLHKKALIGSVSVDIKRPEQMNFCGITWNEFTGKYHLKAKDYNGSYGELTKAKSIINSTMLPGRGTLIPKAVFDEIGLYDAANFPQYAADEDFSLRARKKGWQLIIPTNAYVKSHLNETGVDVENVRMNISGLRQLFFSIKSPLNLKVRYRWAMKNTPFKLLYFLFECSKIIISTCFKMAKLNLRS